MCELSDGSKWIIVVKSVKSHGLNEMQKLNNGIREEKIGQLSLLPTLSLNV